MPRKKAKFFNFIRNSFRSFNLNDSQLNEIWDVIESFDRADKIKNDQTNGNHLKRKFEDNVEQKDEYETENKKPKKEDADKIKNNTDDFDWIEVIKKECNKNQDYSVSLEKLEKKVSKVFIFNIFSSAKLKVNIIYFDF